MANLNPHAPTILGNEWVPIQQANLQPEYTTEYGYKFTLNSPQTVTLATFGVTESGFLGRQNTAEIISIYPAGTEADSGPVAVTYLPVTATEQISGTISTPGAANAVAALAAPFDGSYVRYLESAVNTTMYLDCFFDASAVSGILSGQRILSVDVEFVAASNATVQNSAGNQYCALGLLRPGDTTRVVWAQQTFPVGLNNLIVQAAEIGETNCFWRTPAIAGTADQPEVMPWTYDQLLRFQVGTAVNQRQAIRIVGVASAAQNLEMNVHYLALKITHCSETRVRFGGYRVATVADGYTQGSRSMQMRDLVLAQPALAAGQYVLATTNVYAAPAVPVTSFGASYNQHNTAPPIYAIRQLATLIRPTDGTPVVEGRTIRRTRQVGKMFSNQVTQVIPQLTIHTAAAIISDCHSYGTQIGAPVYNVVAASQKISTTPATGGTYVWVTFYAKRLVTPNGTDRLVVGIVSNPASNVSILDTNFAFYPEVVDGWRKVSIALLAGTVINSGDNIEVAFTATSGVTQGRQWLILGADGPSLVGGQAFGNATYGGAANSLTWQQPNGIVAADPLSDATVMLSMLPPQVTGFEGELRQDNMFFGPVCLVCGDNRCCTVRYVDYIHLSWDQTTLAVSGFKAYRIYRSAVALGGYTLIAEITDKTVTEFDDYEIRTGIYPANINSYRIVVVDFNDVESPQTLLEFAASETGVQMSSSRCNPVGVLAFVSNHDPSLNIAYPMVYDDRYQENFDFPEADTVVMQRMYQRDCQVAFRPRERGCEEFTRDLLVGEPCDPQGTFANILGNFERLRNIAWADIPYVCVRDSDGNVWYATVIVPEGSFIRRGPVYIARDVRIVQTTYTPAPVTLP